MDDDQAAHAFLQLAHVGLLFLGNSAAERQFRELLGFFTQLLLFYATQAFDFRFQRRFLFFQLGVFLGGINQGEAGLLVADQIQAVAQALNFILFDFFHHK